MNYKLKVDESLALNVNEYIVPDMKAIIICVHGMAEHSRRYLDFVKFLNNNKYSVITYDHRGHGKSLLKGEDKGYLGKDGFNKMISDLHLVITTIKAKYLDIQLYLFGHSMGSFIVQRYIQIYNTVDAVILSGSNYGTKLLRLGIVISKSACMIKGEKAKGKLINKLSFGTFNKAFKPNRTDFDWLTRDEQIVDAYIDDDLCGFICSNRFYLDFFKGLIELSKRKNIKKINSNLPVLIISGDKDPVGHEGKGVRKLYQVYKKQIKDVELKLYKDSRHEVLNELNKGEVYQDILNWLER